MDVAYYISELLGQFGEVNVPGLGYFVQLRIDGYYSEEDAVFYPPRHQLHFDPQFLNDDVLTQHIAEKKNISLASSKYFTEKYINNLIQESLTKQVPLADIGWLYFDQRIQFKPAEIITEDPTFYGFTSISIKKLGSTSVFDQLGLVTPEPPPIIKPMLQPEPYVAPETPPEPVLKDEPVSSPEVFTPKPAVQVPYVPQPSTYSPPPEEFTPQTEEQEEFVFRGKTYNGGDENNSRQIIRTILIGLAALLLIAIIGLAALYKFKPAAFRRLMGKKPAPVALTIPLKRDTVKKVVTPAPDTSKKTAAIADTTDKIDSINTTGPIDTLAHIRFELLGGAFGSLAKANTAIENYKKLGIDARILKHATGTLYKITLGTYFVHSEAVEKKRQIVNTGKISADKITIQPYYPKTNP